MAISISYFIRFKQNDYAYAVSLQLSQFIYMKHIKHPVWSLFLKYPDVFLEVKGEWSLSQLASLIKKRNVQSNISYSEEMYMLTKLISSYKQNIYNDDTDFFGYDSLKYWATTSTEVVKMKNVLDNHFLQILNNLPCIYPPINIVYTKKSSIKREDPVDAEVFIEYNILDNNDFEVSY
jgi:hypothetical protein